MSQLTHSATVVGFQIRSHRLITMIVAAAVAAIIVLALTVPGNGSDNSGASASQPAQGSAPAVRYDGGPDEGVAGPNSVSPATRYDGGREEGTAGH